MSLNQLLVVHTTGLRWEWRLGSAEYWLWESAERCICSLPLAQPRAPWPQWWEGNAQRPRPVWAEAYPARGARASWTCVWRICLRPAFRCRWALHTRGEGDYGGQLRVCKHQQKIPVICLWSQNFGWGTSRDKWNFDVSFTYLVCHCSLVTSDSPWNHMKQNPPSSSKVVEDDWHYSGHGFRKFLRNGIKHDFSILQLSNNPVRFLAAESCKSPAPLAQIVSQALAHNLAGMNRNRGQFRQRFANFWLP